MASDNANVFAAEPRATGALLNAPLGTTMPTDAAAAPGSEFIDLGYIGDDGFTESTPRTTTKKRAFGGSVVKVLQTEFGATVKFKFLESLNADVLKRVWGENNVTVTPADATHGTQIKVTKNKKVLPHEAWIIDAIDGDGLYRTCIADGQIVETGDVKIVHTDTIEYEVTIEAFEDADGNNVVTYTDDGVLAP